MPPEAYFTLATGSQDTHCTRTELTNRLHGSSGFRTDYQITTKRMMSTIIAQTKNTKVEK